MKKRLKLIFLNNVKAKIVCTFLAVALWVFVSSSQSSLGKFPNSLPVKVSNLTQNYEATLDEENVSIYLMAESSVWNSLTSESFSATVDTAGLTEGTYELDVKVSSTVTGAQITRIEPSKIFVTIEKIISKKVSVNAKVNGDPQDGMAVGQIDVIPSEVEVRGATSLINQISEVHAEINLNGESATFERESKVYALGEDGKELDGVVYSPASVKLNVPIVKGGNNKTVGIKLKTKNNPKDGYFISKITLSPNAVDITGQSSALTNINYIETEEVDIADADILITKDVNLTLPAGISLQKGSSNKVKVEIVFAQNKSIKTVYATVTTSGLGEGLRLGSIAPNEVKVGLSGDLNLLNTADSSNVKLEINLSNKGVGIHQIDISPQMIIAPSGCTVTLTTPTTLNISITN